MTDKVVYSLIWLGILLWLTGLASHQHGRGWDVLFGALIGSCLVQVGFICYNVSDWWSRGRMRRALEGKDVTHYAVHTPPMTCPHGDSWDDCPDCRH